MSAWNFDMSQAPRDRRFLGAVDGEVRTVQYGKTSHVPLYGFCLADQGAEYFDLCNPLAWQEMPLHPHHMVPADLCGAAPENVPLVFDEGGD